MECFSPGTPSQKASLLMHFCPSLHRKSLPSHTAVQFLSSEPSAQSASPSHTRSRSRQSLPSRQEKSFVPLQCSTLAFGQNKTVWSKRKDYQGRNLLNGTPLHRLRYRSRITHEQKLYLAKGIVGQDLSRLLPAVSYAPASIYSPNRLLRCY